MIRVQEFKSSCMTLVRRAYTFRKYLVHKCIQILAHDRSVCLNVKTPNLSCLPFADKIDLFWIHY